MGAVLSWLVGLLAGWLSPELVEHYGNQIVLLAFICGAVSQAIKQLKE